MQNLRTLTVTARHIVKRQPVLVTFSLAAFAMFILGIGWGLPSEVNPARDSPAPHHILSFFAEYGDRDVASKYPAGHYVITAPFYACVFLVSKLTGELGSLSSAWPYGFKNPSTAFSALIVVSRMLSVMMATGVVICVGAIKTEGERLTRRLISMTLLTTSGVFAYYARVGNLDMPYTFWWALAFFSIWKHTTVSSPSVRWLYAGGIFAGFSIATKDQAVGLVFGLGLIELLIGPLDNAGWKNRAKLAAQLTLVTLLAYGVLAVLPHPARWYHHIQQWSLSSERVADYVVYEPTISGQINLFGEIIKLLAYTISPLGLAFSLVGIIHLIQTKQVRILLLLSLPLLSYYGLILFNIRFVYIRFLVPVSFLLVILAGFGIESVLRLLWRYGTGARLIGVTGVLVVLIVQFVAGFVPITYVQGFDTKQQLSDDIDTYLPEGSAIVWLGSTTALPNARVYENYQLVYPEEIVYSDLTARSVAHIFEPFDPDIPYALSDYPLVTGDNNPELIATWKYPNWVTRRIHVPAVKEYYLYRYNDKPGENE